MDMFLQADTSDERWGQSAACFCNFFIVGKSVNKKFFNHETETREHKEKKSVGSGLNDLFKFNKQKEVNMFQ